MIIQKFQIKEHKFGRKKERFIGKFERLKRKSNFTSTEVKVRKKDIKGITIFLMV